MKLEDYDLQELINRAIEHGACSEEIDMISKFEDMYELLEATELCDDNGHYIYTDIPCWAYWYADSVIKGRWPEAEHIIVTDAGAALWYARDVIKGRWPEAEPELITSPSTAFWYARDVIKRRWPEAEHVIKRSRGLWIKYKKRFAIKETAP